MSADSEFLRLLDAYAAAVRAHAKQEDRGTHGDGKLAIAHADMETARRELTRSSSWTRRKRLNRLLDLIMDATNAAMDRSDLNRVDVLDARFARTEDALLDMARKPWHRP
jgi:hypothetical protein